MPAVLAVSAPHPKFSTNNRSVRTLKRLETARVARLKKAGEGLAAALKEADRRARAAFAEDVADVAQALTDLAGVQPGDDP